MRLLIALFALLPCLGWADVRPAGIPEKAKYAKVDRVYDGDTLVLMGGSRARIIRLDGIDAPERDQPYVQWQPHLNTWWGDLSIT